LIKINLDTALAAPSLNARLIADVSWRETPQQKPRMKFESEATGKTMRFSEFFFATGWSQAAISVL
jgi:hypothetical protein